VFQTGSLKFSALARVYDNYIHVVVPMTSEASTLTDLASLRDRKAIVSVGPKNSGTELIASLILRTAGLDVDKRNMTLEESVDALGKADPNGKAPIDAFIWSGGVPTDPIAALQDKVGFRLLDIGAVAEMIALKEFGGYVVSSIPPSQYKLASSVPTLAVPNYLVAKPTLSDSWAWWTVNTLFRRQNDLINSNHPEAGELDPRSAIATMPVPLHPAAERWYRQNHI
jgi:TRAP transporter TAXI family solute receptor